MKKRIKKFVMERVKEVHNYKLLYSRVIHTIIGLPLMLLTILFVVYCVDGLQQFNGRNSFEMSWLENITMFLFFCGFLGSGFVTLLAWFGTIFGFMFGTWQMKMNEWGLWPDPVDTNGEKYFFEVHSGFMGDCI